MKKRILLFILALFLGIPTFIGLYFYIRFKRDQAKFPMLLQAQRFSVPILLHNVRIYPGYGSQILPAQSVLLEREVIRAMGSNLQHHNAHTIDGKGATLLPGLIDTHVHLLSSGAAPWAFLFANLQHNLQAYLRAGVTTVYELGGNIAFTQQAREHIRRGTWIGPRIYTTHNPITTPGGHPIPASSRLAPWPIGLLAPWLVYQIRSPQEAPAIIADLHKKKADYIKIILDQLPPNSPEMPAHHVVALIREAKRRSLKVFVHIGSAENAVVAAQAGADVLAHGIYRDALSTQQAEIIATSKAKHIFTLFGFEQTVRMAQGKLAFSAFEQAVHPAVLRVPIQGKSGKQFLKTPVLGEFAQSLFRGQVHWHTNLQKLYKAGVPLLVGTDSALPGVFPGTSFHRELQALHRAGIPAAELLTAATSRAAALLHPKPNFGTVAPGMIADLILVDGDPLTDIRNLERIRMVIRKGQVLRFLPASR